MRALSSGDKEGPSRAKSIPVHRRSLSLWMKEIRHEMGRCGHTQLNVLGAGSEVFVVNAGAR